MHMLYVCIHILETCVRVLHVCPRILMPRNANLGILLFYLFCFVLITCLGLVESDFHMVSIKVSRITCFTCFIC